MHGGEEVFLMDLQRAFEGLQRLAAGGVWAGGTALEVGAEFGEFNGCVRHWVKVGSVASGSAGFECLSQLDLKGVQMAYLWKRMDWRTRIVSDKEVLLGKPVIKGTRISVELVLELLAEGWSRQQVLESYPNITADDLQAVFAYLRDGMHQSVYLPLRRTA